MKKLQTLPILLKKQKILLIGGGTIAYQKAKVLYENNIDFTIITKELNPKIKKLTKKIMKKTFQVDDIKTFQIIIDATANPKVAKKLVNYKKHTNILLNVVDKPDLCDFYFMALTQNKFLKVAVSSNGMSPTVAQFFRDECEKLIPKNIDSFLMKKKIERDSGYINATETKQEISNNKTKVYLVGCGLGDPELLTIKAHKTIQNVDVILYDHLISKEILKLIPPKTKTIYVGKKKGFHSKSQEKINKLILKYVSKGHTVARLKSGDPFVFGRAVEELTTLIQYNIKSEVIAGISSSISACSYAGIPITARNYASGFSVVSGHLQGGSFNLDWIDLLKKQNHTTVVLMGLSRIKDIVNEAIKANINKEKPCAIVSNATRTNQSTIITTLQHLLRDSKDVQRPAILVFGDVVKFNTLFKDFIKTD